jgi:hypothetical protein
MLERRSLNEKRHRFAMHSDWFEATPSTGSTKLIPIDTELNLFE